VRIRIEIVTRARRGSTVMEDDEEDEPLLRGDCEWDVALEWMQETYPDDQEASEDSDNEVNGRI